MKIVERETHPGFRFTEIYPFHTADAPDEAIAWSGYFEVVHPNQLHKEVGIRINLTNISEEPYSLAEIEAYIRGLQKALEIATELKVQPRPPTPPAPTVTARAGLPILSN